MSDETLSISKLRELETAEDFELLRELGISHLQKLSGKIWTDYNLHDPGLTILELLCYTLTDLAYRADYDIKDIIAFRPDDKTAENRSFHTALQIFPNNPTTFTDFRKVLMDIDGVRNAWLDLVLDGCDAKYRVDCEKQTITLVPSASGGSGGEIEIDRTRFIGSATDLLLGSSTSGNGSVLEDSVFLSPPDVVDALGNVYLRGMYNVKIQLDDDIEPGSARAADVMADVYAKLHAVRNLCEDYCKVTTIGFEDIGLCMELEVTPQADVNEVMANIYFKLESFVSPQVSFYSLEEMLDMGYSADEIFEGPALTHGFVKDSDVEAAQRITQFHVSDFYNIIMDVEGVLAIRNLTLNLMSDITTQQDWCLTIPNPDEAVPRLSLENCRITFYKKLLPFEPNESKVKAYLSELRAGRRNTKLSALTSDIEIPEGVYRNIGKYTSLEKDMPVIYGVGPDGLTSDASTERQARARQLRGYLLFFEQVIANYFSQLSHVRDLFTWTEAEEEFGILPTYYNQLIKEKDTAWQDIYFKNRTGLEAALAEMAETPEAQYERRNRFLDHLLARFSEEMSDYGLALYTLAGQNAYAPGSTTEELDASAELIRDKARFLRDYPQVSRNRGVGFDMLQPWDFNPMNADLWYTETNITGYERRLARVLGIDNPTRRYLSQYNYEIIELPNTSNPSVFRYRFYPVCEGNPFFNAGVMAVTSYYPPALDGMGNVIVGLNTGYSEAFWAEHYFEEHLQYFADISLYQTYAGGGMYYFRIEPLLANPDYPADPMAPPLIPTPIAETDNIFNTLEECEEAIRRTVWYFQARLKCYPDCSFGEVYDTGGGDYRYRLEYPVITQAGTTWIRYNQVYSVSPPALQSQGDAQAALDALMALGADALFVAYPLEVVKIASDESTILAESEFIIPIPAPALTYTGIAEDVAAQSPEYFQFAPSCDPFGLHVVEHLLLRPRPGATDDMLLPVCVECNIATDNEIDIDKLKVIKRSQTRTVSNVVSGGGGGGGSAARMALQSLTVTAVNLEEEQIRISNLGTQTVSLAGWHLYSVVGRQSYRFPDSASLAAGAHLDVWSGPERPAENAQNLTWSKIRILNNHGDAIRLYSPDHHLASEMSAGHFTDPARNTPAEDETMLEISMLDIKGERVSIRNKGTKAINLSGWLLRSVRGLQTFPFPEGRVLTPGEVLTVFSGRNSRTRSLSSSGLAWTTQNVWRNESDGAVLVSPYGGTTSGRDQDDTVTEATEGLAYYFQVIYEPGIGTEIPYILAESDLFPPSGGPADPDARMKRDLMYLAAFEYGGDFENYEMDDDGSGQFMLRKGPGGDIIFYSLSDAANADVDAENPTLLTQLRTPEEYARDLRALQAYFYRVAHPDSNTTTTTTEEPEVDACQYTADPYSFRVSVIMPGWPGIYGEPGFRDFAEYKIRLETPAHIHAKICWISRLQMRQFEEAYRRWLEANACVRKIESSYCSIRLRYERTEEYSDDNKQEKFTINSNQPFRIRYNNATTGNVYTYDTGLITSATGLFEILPASGTVRLPAMLWFSRMVKEPLQPLSPVGTDFYLDTVLPQTEMAEMIFESLWINGCTPTGMAVGYSWMDFEYTDPSGSNLTTLAFAQGNLNTDGSFEPDPAYPGPYQYETFMSPGTVRLSPPTYNDKILGHWIEITLTTPSGVFKEYFPAQVDPGSLNSSFFGNTLVMVRYHRYYFDQLQDLRDILADLRNIYPGGNRLHDCNNPDSDNKIILGHSNLGIF